MYSAIYRLRETEMPSVITGKPTGCHTSPLFAPGSPLSSVPDLALCCPDLFVFGCFSSVSEAPLHDMPEVPLCAPRQHAAVQSSAWHSIKAKEHGDL